MYNHKYIKTKIKIYNNGVHTNFQYNKIPKDNEYCTCLSVILLDSVFVNSDKEYYPQIFLEECKYTMKKKKIINTINEELELREFDNEVDKFEEYQHIYDDLSLSDHSFLIIMMDLIMHALFQLCITKSIIVMYSRLT